MEEIVFRFTTIFITPLPDFTYNPNEWNGMGYMFDPTNLKAISFFGPSFSSEEYAIDLFKLLMAWNYHQFEDLENNICISFIEEEDAQYRVYIYPNMGDGGLSAGAALYVYAEKNNGINPSQISQINYGPEFSDEEIKLEIEKAGLKAKKYENISQKVA